MSKTVVVPLAKGFEETEAVAMIDVMRRGGLNVIIAGVDEEMVASQGGVVIKTDRLINSIEADLIDMIVLPGGWGGTQILASHPKVQSLLKAMDQQNKEIGAICAAPYALHTAGVLKEDYTCYPSFEEKIGRTDHYHPEKKVVLSGNVMTSRGPGTALCFGLEIVKKLVGLDVYQQLREGLLADYC